MGYALVVSNISADRFSTVVIQNGKITGINYHNFYSYE